MRTFLAVRKELKKKTVYRISYSIYKILYRRLYKISFFFFTFLRQIAQFYSLNWIAPRGRHLQNKKIKNILK